MMAEVVEVEVAEAPVSADEHLESFIQELETGEAQPEPEAQAVEPEEKEETEPIEETQTSSATTDDDIPQLKIIAEREREQREAHDKRLAELRELEERIKNQAREAESPGTDSAPQTLEDKVRELIPGGDLEGFARELIYKKLGDGLPKEAQEELGSIQLKREFAELKGRFNSLLEEREKETKQRETAASEEKAVADFKGSLSEFAGSLPENYPNLSKWATDDRQLVVDEMFHLATQMAQQGRNDDLSPERLASMLEEHLEAQRQKYERLYGVGQAEPAATSKETKAPSKTLSQKSARSTSEPEEDLSNLSTEELIAKVAEEWKPSFGE